MFAHISKTTYLSYLVLFFEGNLGAEPLPVTWLLKPESRNIQFHSSVYYYKKEIPFFVIEGVNVLYFASKSNKNILLKTTTV